MYIKEVACTAISAIIDCCFVIKIDYIIAKAYPYIHALLVILYNLLYRLHNQRTNNKTVCFTSQLH